MNINITLIGQMITFMVLVIITMKYIWPCLTEALLARETKIMQGLQAAEKGEQKLKTAEEFVKRKEAETKLHCAKMIMEAKKQAEKIIELAVNQANTKKQEIIDAGNIEIEKKYATLVQELKNKMVNLIALGTEKILEQRLNLDEHQHIIIDISNKLYGRK